MEKSDNKHAIITVGICFLIAVIEGLDIQAVGIAAAGIREHFGLDSSQLGVFLVQGFWAYCLVHWSVVDLRTVLVVRKF